MATAKKNSSSVNMSPSLLTLLLYNNCVSKDQVGIFFGMVDANYIYIDSMFIFEEGTSIYTKIGEFNLEALKNPIIIDNIRKGWKLVGWFLSKKTITNKKIATTAAEKEKVTEDTNKLGIKLSTTEKLAHESLKKYDYIVEPDYFVCCILQINLHRKHSLNYEFFKSSLNKDHTGTKFKFETVHCNNPINELFNKLKKLDPVKKVYKKKNELKINFKDPSEINFELGKLKNVEQALNELLQEIFIIRQCIHYTKDKITGKTEITPESSTQKRLCEDVQKEDWFEKLKKKRKLLNIKKA